MALSGVRSSCDRVARNSSFTRPARPASWYRRAISRSASLRAVMSSTTARVPEISPSFVLSGPSETLTGTVVPSFRRMKVSKPTIDSPARALLTRLAYSASAFGVIVGFRPPITSSSDQPNTRAALGLQRVTRLSGSVAMTASGRASNSARSVALVSRSSSSARFSRSNALTCAMSSSASTGSVR